MRRLLHFVFAPCLVVAVSGLGAPAVQAGTTQSSISLSGGAVQVKTSAGQTLHLSLSANQTGSSNPVFLNLNLATGTPYGLGETHTWFGAVPAGSFAYTPSSGRGTLNSHNDFMPIGSVNLTFTKTGQSQANCPAGGSETIVKGDLQGAVHLNPNLAPWGNVADNHVTFPSPSLLVINNGCSGGTPKYTCFDEVQWNSPAASTSMGSSYVNGVTYTKHKRRHGRVTGSRTVLLNDPPGAGRTDLVVSDSRLPSLDGDTFSIWTKQGTAATGRATITGGTAQSDKTTCYHNGHKMTQHSDGRAGGAWRTPKRHRLRFHMMAGSDILAPLTGQGGWTQFSYK